MKNKVLFFLLFNVLVIFKVSAQETSIYANKSSLNSIYGSLGFNPGEFYIPLTVNYERILYDAGFVKFNGHIGVGFWLYWTDKGIEFPLTGQIVFFKKASHLEIGGGGLYIYDFADNMTELSHLINISYRYQKPNGNFMFKFGFENRHWVSYPFLSLGYAF